MNFKKVFVVAFVSVSLGLGLVAQSLLNSSYDIARELYVGINKAYADDRKARGLQAVTIKQSHDGSSKQANAIINGLEADVVTFNQVTDVAVLYDKGKLIAQNWQTLFPNNASPYYSLPTILVRKGNPKNITDWQDLAKSGVQIIIPNPKTSGNGRYSYLALYSFAKSKFKTQAEIDTFMKAWIKNVLVFDTGGRAATLSFTSRKQGDALLTFEAEALAIVAKDPTSYTVITPSVSLKAEFPVAVVEKYAKEHNTLDLAKDYLNFLYSDSAQRVAAQFYHRVTNSKVAAEFAKQYSDVKLLDIEKEFGSWAKLNEEHFGAQGKYAQYLR